MSELFTMLCVFYPFYLKSFKICYLSVKIASNGDIALLLPLGKMCDFTFTTCVLKIAAISFILHRSSKIKHF